MVKKTLEPSAVARSVLGKPPKGRERQFALAEWLFSCPEPELVRIAMLNAINLGFYRLLDDGNMQRRAAAARSEARRATRAKRKP